MACGWEAEDCIIQHWLPVLGGRSEPATARAPCPLCGSGRGLSIWVKGKSVAWWNHCECDKDKIRVKLSELLPGCVSARYVARHADLDNLGAYALDRSIPELALRVLLLEMTGMGTAEACRQLGISRAQTYRTVSSVRHHRRS